jgi:adenylate cyclase class 2
MPLEIEVKFLDVDHDQVRTKLRSIGATLEQPMRLMWRTLFDYPDSGLKKRNNGWLRVRDEGNKITLTYKWKGDSKAYSHEVETTVGSYDATVQLLEALGLCAYTYQESRRETWHFGAIEIVLDEWPWLQLYIEIEGPDEHSLKACANDLGFLWSTAFFGSVDTAYREQYPKMLTTESVGAMPELRFDSAMPSWLCERQ